MTKTLAQLLEQEKESRNLDGLFATLVEEIRKELETEKNEEVAKFREEIREEIELGKEEIREAVNYAKSIKPEKGDRGDSIRGDKPILGIDYTIPTAEEIAKKVKKPKDGKTPIAGIDFPIPKDGKDGTEIEGKEIVQKVNKLPLEKEFQIDAKHIKNLPEKVIERIVKRVGGGVSVDYKDLSSQLDGVIKTFTLPTHTKVFSIDASSAPFSGFRPLTDWTETRTSITFTASVDATISLAAGQSLIIWYLK